MTTTYTNFVTNLGNLSITSVKRAFDEPPQSLNTADLPALWVELPTGEEDPFTMQAHGGYPTFRGNLVVAVEAAGQSRQPERWSDCLTMMDNVATALRAAVKTVVRGQLSWSIALETITVAENDYWSIVATVEGNG
jgi:hypothetical protein